MARTTLTGRESDQDTSKATKASRRRLTSNATSVAEALAQRATVDFEFEPRRLREGLFKPVTLD